VNSHRVLPAMLLLVSAISGYHLYYPSRRQTSPAFSLLVDALRYKRR
jgi:hypothetical protein